ncbi:hypothetical protein NA78x_003487 [Anatilimnocola sp. NA78]|uniref:hypothetical protein n=1 Tax=Anatilimnocola sp. NA78 TaxID=3415683 RepID=UPI003CE5A9D9
MRKRAHLYVAAFAATVVVLGLAIGTTAGRILAADKPEQGGAAAKSLADKLIGTWTLDEAKTPGSPSGVGTRLKSFTGTHWMITQPDPKTGVVVFHHGGRYTLDGATLKTTTDFAGESTKSRVGIFGEFKINVDGDTFKQTDANGTFNETWKRVK